MDSTKWISKKIALLGSHAVGKTSLISRFVYSKFPENYLTTIGLKVDKKSISSGGYRLDMIIWDIAGQDHIEHVPTYYLNGCSGIIYVVDLTRPSTYKNFEDQLLELKNIIHNVQIVVAANKADLLDNSELENVLKDFDVAPDIVSSAKLGHGVEEMFEILAEKLVSHHESQGA